MKERLNQDIKAALLRGDSEIVDALRFLKSSLDGSEKQKGSDLSDQEIIGILRKEVKKRDEAADLFEKGGNKASADKERKEAELIKTYLPSELSEQEITDKLKALITENNIQLAPSSMGQVMTLAKQNLGDSANPSVIASVASQLLKSGQ